MSQDDKKIVQFVERKKEKEKGRQQNSIFPVDPQLFDSLFAQSDDMTKEKVGELLGSFGIEMDEDMKRQIFEMLQSNDFKEMIKNVTPEDLYSGASIDKITKNTKEMNSKLKDEYRNYREIGQWRRIYKPYTLEKFLMIEHAHSLADKLGISVSSYESKNQILEKVKPELPEYLRRVFLLFDQSRMQWVGDFIYHEGIYYLDHILADLEEKKVDYLQGLHLVERVNDHSRMALVVPKEILEAVYAINFKELEAWHHFNTQALRLLMGMGNAYGVYPTEAAFQRVSKCLPEEKAQLFSTEEAFVDHLRKLAEDSFGNLFSRSYYEGIKISSDYLFHSAVGLPQEYAGVQKETMEGYKDFSKEELLAQGAENFYEDSIFLETVWEIMEEKNGPSAEESLVKQMVYTFSKAEFEPQLVLTFLSTLYELPTSGSSYQILTTALKSLSKSTGKWMLGGFSMGETSRKQEDEVMKKVDVSKIVDIAFYKNKEE